ncbi:MAG: ATP-binding protein [Erysipelotrichaceae bacterium]|nr:ATP-binding protein [Erysipelotrichaceae bacterium]
MNHDLLKAVIYDQHDIIKSVDLIKRDYSFEYSLNYVLTGLRRAGKTMQLYSVVRDLISNGVEWNQIIYINFEDERLAEFSMSDFNDIVLVKNEMTDKKGYYFFDEIQNIEGWEKFARRMADQKEFVYITGSNARMLSREIGATLGGRFISKYISTLSFDEFLTGKKQAHDERALLATATKGKILREFEEYYTYGGFPETLGIKSKREYVSNVYQKIILSDVMIRNNLRNESALKLIVKKTAESVRSEISYTKLHNMVKAVGVSISKDSLIDYIGYMKDAYLLFSVRNWYASFVEKESNPKYYFNDNGLLNLFLIDKSSSLLENLVGKYLHDRYQEELFYLKSTKTKIDIDFYLPETNLAVQVAYSISDTSREREIGNLVKFAQSSPEARLIIVTYNEEETIEENGVTIQVIPAYKFILG